MPDHDFLAAILAAMAQSELVAATTSVQCDGGCLLALDNVAPRHLSNTEINYLESLANTAEDWSRIRVAVDFDGSRIHHSHFQGDVVLGQFAGEQILEEGIRVPAGIYRSTLANCVIGHNALIRDVKLLSNYVIGPNAQLYNCLSITCGVVNYFGNGQSLVLGLKESCELKIFADITIPEVAAWTRGPANNTLRQAYVQAIVNYLAKILCKRGIIEAGACLRNTPNVQDSYVGKYAQIDGAGFVAGSTLLSSRQEATRVLSGACVSQSILQCGSRAANRAFVDRSVLMGYASAENQATITASILGSGTRVGESRVTACLLGPMTDLQRESELHAVLWPDGKGTINQGAHLGTNRTNDRSDQELRIGEGIILGQGAKIRFPADFSESPFSVIGSGVETLPQRVAFPFSLINLSSAEWEGILSSHNEIFPAWVLTDNLYALVRLESNFTVWNRPRRSRAESDLFRPDIVDLMLDACRRLHAISRVKEVYTEFDIEGLGKNVLLELNRRRAIDAYQFFAKYDALLGLKRRSHGVLHALQGRVHGDLGGWRNYAVRQLLDTPAEEPRWEHQRRILKEKMHCGDVISALVQLPEMLEMVAQGVELARARNHERAVHIIDNGVDQGATASQDALVQQTWTETRRLQQEVGSLLSRLKVEEAAPSGECPVVSGQ